MNVVTGCLGILFPPVLLWSMSRKLAFAHLMFLWAVWPKGIGFALITGILTGLLIRRTAAGGQLATTINRLPWSYLAVAGVVVIVLWKLKFFG